MTILGLMPSSRDPSPTSMRWLVYSEGISVRRNRVEIGARQPEVVKSGTTRDQTLTVDACSRSSMRPLNMHE